MDRKRTHQSIRDSLSGHDIVEAEHYPRVTYRMIAAFDVDNFRGFQKLRLDGLKTINIIVGRSGAGKTAFLEAIRLALGATPAVAWNLNAQRGVLTGIPPNPTRKQFESGWSTIFYGFDVESNIKLSVTDSEGVVKQCSIYFDHSRKSPPVVPQPNQPVLPDVLYPLAFNRLVTGEPPSQIYAEVVLQNQPHLWAGQILQQISNYQMQMQSGAELGPVCEMLHANIPSNLAAVAQKYSELSIAGSASEIDKTLMDAFPEITSIQTETPSAGAVSLYASIRNQSRLVPLSLYSAGISKFITLLVEIQSRGPSVLLVDEIENGIWYRLLPDLWRALHKFATKNDTQLFVSTHSWECLKAATETIDKYPNDFSMLQVYQDEGKSEITVVPGENAAAAIENEIEVRR